MSEDTRVPAAEPLSYESVVLRYAAPLKRFFSRRMRDFASAENLVQETFLRVFRYADSYVPGGTVSRWVYAIATNLWRDVMRRESRLPVVGGVDLDTLEPRHHGAAPGNPEALALDRDVEQALLGVLAEVPQRHRTVFVLKHHYGLTYTQIGEVMRISEGTAKSRMHKATRLVAEKMSRRGYFRNFSRGAENEQ